MTLVISEQSAEPDPCALAQAVFEAIVFAGILAIVACVAAVWLVRKFDIRSRWGLTALASLPLPLGWLVFLWRPFTFDADQSRLNALSETIQSWLGMGLVLAAIFGWLGVSLLMRKARPLIDPTTFE